MEVDSLLHARIKATVRMATNATSPFRINTLLLFNISIVLFMSISGTTVSRYFTLAFPFHF